MHAKAGRQPSQETLTAWDCIGAVPGVTGQEDGDRAVGLFMSEQAPVQLLQANEQTGPEGARRPLAWLSQSSCPTQ